MVSCHKVNIRKDAGEKKRLFLPTLVLGAFGILTLTQQMSNYMVVYQRHLTNENHPISDEEL
jgi:hypothetical protein